MKNKILKMISVSVLAAAVTVSLAACGSSSEDGSASEEEGVMKDASEYDTDRTLEEIIASIEEEITSAGEELTEEWNEIFSGDELYTDSEELTEAVETWHATALERSQPLYEAVLDDVVSYCLVVADTMSDSASYYISNAMADVADVAFENGLYAYEDVVCSEGCYNEIYDIYFGELSEAEVDDTEAWNAAYDDFYEMMTEFIEDWETNLDIINVTYHAFDDAIDDGIFDEEELFEEWDYRLTDLGE